MKKKKIIFIEKRPSKSAWGGLRRAPLERGVLKRDLGGVSQSCLLPCINLWKKREIPIRIIKIVIRSEKSIKKSDVYAQLFYSEKKVKKRQKMVKKVKKMVKKVEKRSKQVKKGQKGSKTGSPVFNYRMCRDPFSRDKKSIHVPVRVKKSVEIDINAWTPLKPPCPPW